MLKKTDWHLVHIGSILNLELFFLLSRQQLFHLKEKLVLIVSNYGLKKQNKLKMVLSSIYNVNHQCQSPFNWSMLIEKFQLIFHGKPIIKDMHPILPS